MITLLLFSSSPFIRSYFFISCFIFYFFLGCTPILFVYVRKKSYFLILLLLSFIFFLMFHCFIFLQVKLCLLYLRERIGVPRDMTVHGARQFRAHINWFIDKLDTENA